MRPERRRLSEAARVADPDPWRNELRTALDQADKAARLAGLQALAKTAKFDELGAISLHLLGTGLNDAGDSALAESVLRAAQQRHPGDVWVNYALGRVLEKLSRRDEAIRFYTAARAIRPETAHELAHALEIPRRFRRGHRRVPRSQAAAPRQCPASGLPGQALKAKGLSAEAEQVLEAAVAAGREAIRLRPDYALPTTTSAPPCEARASSTRPSPNTAPRSGSSPTTPAPTTTSAWPWRSRASWTRPSPNTARRSGSSPTSPKPTLTSASP